MSNNGKNKAEWKPINRPPRNTNESNPVDIWMHVTASLRSMGWGDSWRIPDCWLKDGKWVHRYKGEIAELEKDHITHWVRPPKPPKFKYK